MNKTLLLIPVYGSDGKEIEKVELSPEIFSVSVSDDLIAQYIHVYLSNQRQGTAHTQLRSEVTATTKKVYRQKGTGLARHGSRRANVFKGGGVTFGPKPRNFTLKMNKKQKRKVLLGVLTERFKEGLIYSIADEVLESVKKTKDLITKIKIMPFSGKHQLYVLPVSGLSSFSKVAGNIENLNYIDVGSINPYVGINCGALVFTKTSLAQLGSNLGSKNI